MILSPSDFDDPPLPAPGSDLAVEGSRLRFVDARLERAPAGISRVVVEFAHPDGTDHLVGRQEGTACPGGDLRLTALATLGVLARATEEAIGLELIGVKPVRAFDTTVVMVAVMARHGGAGRRFVGAAVVERNEIEATVRATLQALNRLLAPMLPRGI